MIKSKAELLMEEQDKARLAVETASCVIRNLEDMIMDEWLDDEDEDDEDIQIGDTRQISNVSGVTQSGDMVSVREIRLLALQVIKKGFLKMLEVHPTQ